MGSSTIFMDILVPKRPHYTATGTAFQMSWPRRCCATKPVVDGFAETLVGDRHHRDRRGASAIERAQVREQVGGGLDQVAGGRQTKHLDGALAAGGKRCAEGEQRLARLHVARIKP